MAENERLAVYGATGHTGRQVAKHVRRRGFAPVLAGRDAARLEAVAREVPGAQARVAALEDEKGLAAAFEGCVAVINCAGPFMNSLDSVVAAAIESGAHYVDFTAEQEAVLRVFDRWDRPAREAGVALVPAMGFFGALGDLLVSITASGLPRVEEVTIAYAVSGWLPTEGSRATAADMAGRRRAWRDGQLELVTGDPRFSSFEYPVPVGTATVLEDYPLPEVVTVPRHLQTPTIRAVMTSSTLQEVFSPDAPDPADVSDEARAGSRFVLAVVVRDGTIERRSSTHGVDIYGITAPIVVEAAIRLVRLNHAGALTPSEAFPARDFLACLEVQGLELQTTSGEELPA